MREIKFRAWDPEENTMRNDISVTSDGIAESSWGKEKYNWTVLQYTGIKDQEGVDIYEGDIIEVYNWGMKDKSLLVTAQVFWDDEEHSWTWGIPDSFWSSTPKFYVDIYDRWRNVKVIGNIYENPELL